MYEEDVCPHSPVMCGISIRMYISLVFSCINSHPPPVTTTTTSTHDDIKRGPIEQCSVHHPPTHELQTTYKGYTLPHVQERWSSVTSQEVLVRCLVSIINLRQSLENGRRTSYSSTASWMVSSSASLAQGCQDDDAKLVSGWMVVHLNRGEEMMAVRWRWSLCTRSRREYVTVVVCRRYYIVHSEECFRKARMPSRQDLSLASTPWRSLRRRRRRSLE